MFWNNYPTIAYSTMALWLIGSLMVQFSGEKKIIRFFGEVLVILGIGVMIGFITELWKFLERPPMRTLGETRLWYALFIAIIGYITFRRYDYKIVLLGSVVFGMLFLKININHPETYSKTLMPALQSPWFIPHVIVYIISYAILGLSMAVALIGLYNIYFKEHKPSLVIMADNLVYIGFAFLTLGLLFGALWAKEAWGHYWTWDPKETWAFLTWLGYLVYIHYRYRHKKHVKAPLWILAFAFVVLLIAWFGVNYLPSANESVHTYSQG